MPEKEMKIYDRRRFLKDSLRALVFTTLVAAGTVLGIRKSPCSERTSACGVQPPCRSCRLRSGCLDPGAAGIPSASGRTPGRSDPDSSGGRK